MKDDYNHFNTIIFYITVKQNTTSSIYKFTKADRSHFFI